MIANTDTYYAWLLIAVATTFLLLACSSGQGVDSPLTEADGPSENATHASNSDDVELSHAEIDLVTGADTYQKRLFEDGVLSFNEYERAVFDYLACVAEGGLSVASGPTLDAFNIYSFTLTYGDDLFDDAPGIQRDCMAKYYDHVSRIWQINHGPTEQQLQEFRDYLGECARRKNIEMPEHPTASDIADEVNRSAATGDERFVQCVAEFQEVYNAPGLLP